MANIKNKFRFWNSKKKIFIDAHNVSFKKDGRISNQSGILDISQSTGLFDKNGLEIYEGDVLSVNVQQAGLPCFRFIGIVEYVPGEFILNDGNVFYYRINQYNSKLCYEVMSNIYKDPLMNITKKHPKN